MDRLPYEAKVVIWQRAKYVPNRLQIPIHRSTNSQDFVSGGWRSGKSVVVAAEALPHCLIPSPRPYLIAFIGPTYAEPREEMRYVVDWLSSMLPRRQFDPDKNVSWPKEGKVEVTIPPQVLENGTKIHFATLRTYTADEAVRIRAFNADAVLVCEAGGITEEALFNILGRVLSTGGWVLGSGTLEQSEKWYHNVVREGLSGVSPRGIRSFILPSWANEVAFPGGREDPRIVRLERLLPHDLFLTRIGGEPIRLQGVAVQEASAAHVSDKAVFDASLPVELAIDPGYTGAYSVLAIQYYDGQVRVVDEVYERFKSTPEIVEICKSRPWWVRIDESDPGVIDRAAKQHRDTDGMSVLEKWAEACGMWFDLTEAVIGVADGLEQLRIHLHKPARILINPACRGLLGEWDLGEFPDGVDGEPWHYAAGPSGNLLGDDRLRGANHSSTALIYWLIHRFGFLSEETHDFTPTQLVPLHDEYGPSGGLTDTLGRPIEMTYAS